MADYNRGGRRGGGDRRRGGGGRDFRGRDSGPRRMHQAVCDECGNKCEVPFRPSGDKPIYCSDCFEKKDGGKPRGQSRDGGSNGKQLEALGKKLDRIIELLEKKSPKKKKATSKKDSKKTKKAKD